MNKSSTHFTSDKRFKDNKTNGWKTGDGKHKSQL